MSQGTKLTREDVSRLSDLFALDMQRKAAEEKQQRIVESIGERQKRLKGVSVAVSTSAGMALGVIFAATAKEMIGLVVLGALFGGGLFAPVVSLALASVWFLADKPRVKAAAADVKKRIAVFEKEFDAYQAGSETRSLQAVARPAAAMSAAAGKPADSSDKARKKPPVKPAPRP